MKSSSTAPRERVNITYRPATGEARESVELPLKLLVLTDLTGQADPRPVEERAPISLDRDNFRRVMAEQKLCVQTTVKNCLSSDPDATLSITLPIKSMADLSPDGIVAKVPALQKLVALRRALIALKGPMGNVPAFRKKIEELLGDEATRHRLLAEVTRTR